MHDQFRNLKKFVTLWAGYWLHKTVVKESRAMAEYSATFLKLNHFFSNMWIRFEVCGMRATVSKCFYIRSFSHFSLSFLFTFLPPIYLVFFGICTLSDCILICHPLGETSGTLTAAQQKYWYNDTFFSPHMNKFCMFLINCKNLCFCIFHWNFCTVNSFVLFFIYYFIGYGTRKSKKL